MRELTGKQREVLAFIRTFIGKHGVPPTVREIGDRFKVTPRAAFDHLRALERKGALQRRASAGRTSRALTPAEPAVRASHAVPILGRVAAGQPLFASENREGELHIAPASLPGRGEDLFALRVRGDSMISAHICDGDQSESGEGEATVKRFSREGERVVLKPEHPTMAPIIVDPRHTPLRILGKVVGVLRGF